MTDGAQKLRVTGLMAGAQDHHYTLPDELTEAWRLYEGVRSLKIVEPEVLTTENAAARLVAEVAAGRSPDVLEFGHDLQSGIDAQRDHGNAQRVWADAQQQALSQVVFAAVDSANRVIVDHLKPAFAATLDEARRCAAAGGVNPGRLAPEKARKAAEDLDVLVRRRLAIFDARSKVVALTGRGPENDGAQFLYLRKPEALAHLWNPKARWPGIDKIAPADPVERLVWFAFDEVAPAEPWVPTVEEQDAAWLAVYGDQLEARRRMESDARAISAMFPDRERRDPRIQSA